MLKNQHVDLKGDLMVREKKLKLSQDNLKSNQETLKSVQESIEKWEKLAQDDAMEVSEFKAKIAENENNQAIYASIK